MTINKLSEYGHSFQIKVLASLLTDKKFLQNIIDILTPDFFESEAHKWIIQYILEYYSKYHTYPTMEVLHVELKKQRKESLKVSIIENLREVYTSSADDVHYIQEEFFNFCKNQALKGALLQSVELLNDGNYEDIRRLIDGALKSGREKDIGHDYTVDTEERFREECRKLVPFPWPIFNTITDGGIGSGDLMILFAPPGIGKSTVVCCMAAHAIQMGFKVVYYSLELTAEYVGKKIDSIITGIPVKQIKNHREQIDAAMAKIPGRLKIKRYYAKKASLETIESHLNNLRNNEDFIPDMVIIDYPDLLKVHKARKDLKQEIDDIYVEIKGMAGEMNIPFVCPSQINRAGMKDDIIEGDKVAGSFDKTMIADFSVSLSRKRKDKLQNTGRFHIMKSRLGPDGMTYNSVINLERGYINISEEEYDEDDDGGQKYSANGGQFDSDELKEMRSAFHKFEKKEEEATVV